MANAIEFTCTVHCDGCGHDETVEPSKMADYVDKKCPKCGLVMFTEDDYRTFQDMTAMADMVNAVAGPVDSTTLQSDYGQMGINVKDGKLEVTDVIHSAPYKGN
jgi:phage FluMu protein Com